MIPMQLGESPYFRGPTVNHSNVDLILNPYSYMINSVNTVVADTLDKAVNR